MPVIRHSNECEDNAFIFHAATGGDAECICEHRSRRRGQHPGQDHRPPSGQASPEQHSGDDDPSETVHAPVIGHSGASLPVSGQMSDIEAMKARLAELPADNAWARP